MASAESFAAAIKTFRTAHSHGAAAARKWGFEDMGLDHIVAAMCPHNVVSPRVLERIGMKSVRIASLCGTEVMRSAFHREDYLRRNRN